MSPLWPLALHPAFGASAHLFRSLLSSTGVGEKNCCDFATTLPSSISGTRSRAMRRWKAHDEKNTPIVFVFLISLIEGFASWFCCFWLDGKKQFALQFLVPSSKKYEKIHEPFLMMVTTLIFTPKRKSLVFSRSAAVRQRVHQ